MTFLCDILPFIIIVFLLLLFNRRFRTAVRSGFTNLETVCVEDRCYKVMRDYNNKDRAAEILHVVDSDINKLIQHMSNKYSAEVLEAMPEGQRRLYSQIVRRLRNTYSTDSLEETLPSKPMVDVSYNLNKGEVVALCVRDYETHEFHKKNDITFVALHELAHSLNCDESSFQCGKESYGHTDIFWFIFRVLLENATECGVYERHDYHSTPITYCSMPVTYSPLYDDSLNANEFFRNR